MKHHYKITKQYGRSPENALPEKFTDFDKAKAVVMQQLENDAALSIKSVYRIYKDDELHSEYDSTKIETPPPQSAGRGSSFSPSPLKTAPRPGGIPHSSLKKEEDDEDEKS